jgi:hypothetical protein
MATVTFYGLRLKNRAWRALTAIRTPIFGLFIIVYDTSRDMKIVLFIFSISLFLYLISIYYIKIGYRKYLSTFIHNYYASVNIFTCGYITLSFILISIYAFIITNSYYHAIFSSFFVFIVGIYLFNMAIKFTKINFQHLYCMINNKVFFNHYNYAEKIEVSVSKIYFKLCFREY